MNLKPIVDYLADNGIGTPGVDLFRHAMPAEVSVGILVLQHTPAPIDAYTGLRSESFQVVVRGMDYEVIRGSAEAISQLLDTQGLTLGSLAFKYVRPKAEPLIYPRSEGNLLEASVNFEFRYAQT